MQPKTPPKITHNIAVRLYDPLEVPKMGAVKLLLVKLDHIGDFITALNAFRIIRDAFAGAEITLICLPSIVPWAQSTGLFDKVKGFASVPESKSFNKLPQMDNEDRIAAFTDLLDGAYFLAADFKHDPAERFLLDHVEAQHRAGFTAQTKKGMDIMIPPMEWDAPMGDVAVRRNLPMHAETRSTLLAHAIVDSLTERASIADIFGSVDFSALPAYSALKNETRMKIGISVGAGSELRQWKSDYWRTLLQKFIQQHNAVVVFFGGAGDRAETDAINTTLPPGSFIDLVGAVDLPALPACMGLLNAYIGCDTGLTHLAARLNLPTVNIYAGISNISTWRARGARIETVYAEVVCSPCHLRFKSECPNNNICMSAIVPDIVYACFQQVMTNS